MNTFEFTVLGNIKKKHECLIISYVFSKENKSQKPWLGKSQCNEQVLKSNFNSNITSFFRFVNKRAIYRLGIISLAHAPVHVTDFPVVYVHVDKLSSARIWRHKLCATFSANVNISYPLPIKVYYRICTLRHIRIEINHGSQNVFWVLSMGWIGGY